MRKKVIALLLTVCPLLVELMFVGAIVASHSGKVIDEQNLISAAHYPMRVKLENGLVIAVDCGSHSIGSPIVINEYKSLILGRSVYSCAKH